MSSGSLKVKIFDSTGTQMVAVPKSTLTVGSANHCDIVLNHPSVQAEHVRGWLEGGRIWVQDLGGGAGTFLNGIRLPSLKPMLVRELDVLKIGECPQTLGLEANLVRAPVVKPKPVMEEFTGITIRPVPAKEPELDKKREELAKLSREVAELKLSLQMGRLDKNAEDALHRQAQQLREEIRILTQDKDQLASAVRRTEQDLEKRRANFDKELAELRESMISETKRHDEEKTAKINQAETWKADAVTQLTHKVKELSAKKAKAWVTRPISQDMIFEWEADLNILFRRIILNEDIPDAPDLPPMPPEESSPAHALTGITYLTTNPPSRSGASSGGTSVTSFTRSQSRSRLAPKPSGAFSMRFAGLALIAAVVGFLGWGRLRGGGEPVSVQRMPASHSKARFEPQQSKGFKKSYTDNVLFTTLYVDAELNSEFRNLWLAEVQRTAQNEWKIDAKSIKALSEKEFSLLQDLRRLRDGIQAQNEEEGIRRMRDREAVFVIDATAILRDKNTLDKYMKLKKNFFNRNQAYLVKRR
jgi:hypothetical protein